MSDIETEREPSIEYSSAAPGYDECVESDGTRRPHYERFLKGLAQLGPAELRRRWDSCPRLVQEHGITYNVYGDPRGMERPWELDPVPLILSHDEWRGLEAALIQRATLLNRILADCYGPQELVRRQGLPPALVFGQPDFVRPCRSVPVPNGAFLHFYAADLARSREGRWWVISDRTQIPTGVGYALANRLVTSRILPETFRDCRTQRLAGFFRDLQASLHELGALRAENPRIVLLSPGPHNETYFEQAYLARYLGYTLVEGQDLTVRDDRVFLKTLSGLEPVDVILRRVDDDFCDPLELRNDSVLGVPGLLQALRAGNVALANPLGSGLLQSPAFLAFLPGLCRQLLGEELRMPSVATWWCGQEQAKRHVLENLDGLFVKPAFRATGPSRPWIRRRLDVEDLTALRERIEFQPQMFVAQEWVEFSNAPSCDPGGLVARPVGLRVYVVSARDGYRVMPGGLTRVASDGPEASISMQRGGASKDTWVLSDCPVEEITLLGPKGRAVELKRAGDNLPSRMADNFFWVGRYAERADASARILRAALARFSPESPGRPSTVLAPLLAALERQGNLARDAGKPDARQSPEALEAELLAAVLDPARPGSLRSIAEKLQHLAMLIRSRSSNDMWRILSRLDDLFSRAAKGGVLLAGDAVAILNQALLILAAFHGQSRENMTRGQAWRFLDMGRRIERAVGLCAVLDCALSSPDADDPSVLEAVLEVCDCTITYRSRYNLLPSIVAVYDLLLLDETHPRSLLFQLSRLRRHLERLPRAQGGSLPAPGRRLVRECLARLRAADPRSLSTPQGRRQEGEIGGILARVLRDLPKISDALASRYFAHARIWQTGGGGK